MEWDKTYPLARFLLLGKITEIDSYEVVDFGDSLVKSVLRGSCDMQVERWVFVGSLCSVGIPDTLGSDLSTAKFFDLRQNEQSNGK
jgi:hypothetical protein